MRVVMVHSFYRSASPGGESEVVEAEVAALTSRGHDVRLIARRTDDVSRRRAHTVRSALEVATNSAAAPWDEVRRLRPDVVHVHNLFPNFSTKGLPELAQDFPVVARLHNYRAFCSSAVISRQGKPECTDCLSSRWSAVRHRCYRNSALATVPVALSRRFEHDVVLTSAASLIAITAPMKARYERFGVTPEKVVVLENCVPDTLAPAAGPGGDRFVFVGRLSPEKGAVELLRAWPGQLPLDVVGDGPLGDVARGVAPSSVRFWGRLDRRDVLRLLGSSRGLVVPSMCPEGLPLVYLEALASGTPTLALDSNDLADVVASDGAGMVASWADLASSAERAHREFPTRRVAARRLFENAYTESHHVEALERVYARVIACRTASTRD
jgi:glycosyltransferase involved in cell wall biosynthesis